MRKAGCFIHDGAGPARKVPAHTFDGEAAKAAAADAKAVVERLKNPPKQKPKPPATKAAPAPASK